MSAGVGLVLPRLRVRTPLAAGSALAVILARTRNPDSWKGDVLRSIAAIDAGDLQIPSYGSDRDAEHDGGKDAVGGRATAPARPKQT